MANKYTDILNITANGKNQMGLSNTIKRDYGIPLDFTSVQADFAAAVNYAATSTLSYVGQPISVGDKLYIVTAESQGKYPPEVEEGGSQIDVFLAEVGSATEGDDNTIVLKDGVLSLAGIDGKTSGTYVPTLVDGVLTWNAPDNTTVDGLTASVDALNLKVFGKAADEEAGTEKVDGLVDIVAAQAEAIEDNAKAIADETTARENAITDITKAETGAIAVAVKAEASARETAITGINNKIGTVDEDTTIVEMIGDVRDSIPTDNKDLTNGAGYQTASDVATAIANKADKATTLEGYGITDAYTQEQVNKLISDITHFSTAVVTDVEDVTSEGVLYLIKDESVTGVDKYNEYLFIGGAPVLIGDTTTDLKDYVTNSALTEAIKDFVTTSALATALEPYAKTDAVNTELGKKVDASTYATDKETFAIKSDVETALNGKADKTTLGDYYTKTEANDLLDDKADKATVETELAKKIETAQLTHTTEGVGEGVTKEGTALKIVVDAYRKSEVYTKSETDNQIDAKIASVTGGESAADVKLALESYRDAINGEIWGAKAAEWTKRTTDEDGKVVVTYTPQYGETSRVDELEVKVGSAKAGETAATGLFAKVDAAQAKADQVATDLATLETTTIATHTQNIATIQAQITGENGLSSRIGALEQADKDHNTHFQTLKGRVDAIVDTTIPAIDKRVSDNTTAITAINNTLNGVGETAGLIATVAQKANAADVYTKGEVDAKVITSGEVVHGTADSVTIANNKITVTVNSYTKGEVDNLLANLDQTELENGIAANKEDIAVLVGEDKDAEGKATKSVRAIAKEEVALIVGTAPEALNTLEEVAEWIENDESGAAAMAADIADHKAILAGFKAEDGTITTVKSAIQTAKEEAIAAATYTLEVATAEKLGGVKSATGDNKVTVAADGTQSVASVNVNTLTQTVGHVLILNGGTASV